jgi:hypothetical protein
MNNVAARAADECPLLQPCRPRHDDVRVAIYCRFPDGRVRIPAPEEKLRLCLTQGWQHYPVSLDHAAAS